MGWIVHIETATEVCSVAIAKDGVIPKGAYKESKRKRSHAELVAIFTRELLQENNIQPKQLDAVAVSKGPGSYTGLRIGVSTAKGIAYTGEIPLIALNTLEIMTNGLISRWQQEKPKGLEYDANIWFCPMIDARRLEVYTAFFDATQHCRRNTSADIIDADSYQEILEERKLVFFGNGSIKCKEIIKHPNAYFVEGIYPHAGDMVKLANQYFQKKQFVDTAYFEPFYLKDFIATTPKNKVLP